jgi:type IV secretion system protein VirB6
MTIRKHIASFIIFLFALSIPAVSHAKLLDDCIKGFDFGTLPDVTYGSTLGNVDIRVTPINLQCYELCENVCNSLSRKSPPIEGGLELNNGPINECLYNCRSGGNPIGNLLKKYIIRQDNGRMPKKNLPFVSDIQYVEARTDRVCSKEMRNVEADPSAAETYFYQDAKSDSIKPRIKITPEMKAYGFGIVLKNKGQKIYRCGKKEVHFKPMIASETSSEWNNSLTQTVWKNKNSHKCLMWLTDGEWARLKNTGLWATTGSNFCSWHARNPNYVDTGLLVKDGDELNLTWYSNLGSSNLGSDIFSLGSFSTELNRSNVFNIINDTNTSAGDKALYSKVFRGMGQLHISPPVPNTLALSNSTNRAKDLIEGELARYFALNNYIDSIGMIGKQYDAEVAPQASNANEWHGLVGKVNDLGVSVQFNTSQSICASKNDIDSNDKNNKCMITTNPGKSTYSFSGKLDGYSSDRTPLGVRHPNILDEIDSRPSLYNSQFGGNDLTISWGGCPAEDGVGLEYSERRFGLDADGKMMDYFTQWFPISDKVLRGEEQLRGNFIGMDLVFRIAPLQNPGDSKFDEMYNPANYYGDYVITFVPPVLNNTGYFKPNGPIASIVKTVYETLFGINGQGGIVETLYRTLVEDSRLIRGVQALMTLYVAFVGLGFVMGTIEIKQQDLIYRMIKLAFVIAVISPGSWDFYYNNFFIGVIDGGIQLIALMVTGSFGDPTGTGIVAQETAIEDDPSYLFGIFDGLLSQLFGDKVWRKIGTLFFMGFAGFWMMLMIIIAILMYAIAVFKASLVYMMSLVMVAVLLFVAPVMIPMVLFKFTREVFDTWWKMIISYSLQPVGLFAGIAIFNTLFAATIYATLSFTICPYCLVGIGFPGIGYQCIIHWWQPLLEMFTPDDASSDPLYAPIGMFAGSLVLLMLGHAMLEYCDFVTKLIGNIISGNLTSRSGDLSGYSGEVGAMAVNNVNSGISGVASAGMKLKASYSEGRALGQRDAARR